VTLAELHPNICLCLEKSLFHLYLFMPVANATLHHRLSRLETSSKNLACFYYCQINNVLELIITNGFGPLDIFLIPEGLLL
jgi:hypothetical protein